MATCIQLLFLINKSLNSTFTIRLQNVINGVDLIVLGSHEGFSYFPKSLTLHNCCKHCHTYWVMLPLMTVCTLRAMCFALGLFVTAPVWSMLWEAPRIPKGPWCTSPARAWLLPWLQDPMLWGVKIEDGLWLTVQQKPQRWYFSSLLHVLYEELERVWVVATSLDIHSLVQPVDWMMTKEVSGWLLSRNFSRQSGSLHLPETLWKPRANWPRHLSFQSHC